MPSTYDSQRTDYKDSAAILRGLADRVSDLEQQGSVEEKSVQLSRQVDEVVHIADTIAVQTADAGSFEYDTSKYARADWGGTGLSNEHGSLNTVLGFSVRETIPSVDESGRVTVRGRARAVEQIHDQTTPYESGAVTIPESATATETWVDAPLQHEDATVRIRPFTFVYESVVPTNVGPSVAEQARVTFGFGASAVETVTEAASISEQAHADIYGEPLVTSTSTTSANVIHESGHATSYAFPYCFELATTGTTSSGGGTSGGGGETTSPPSGAVNLNDQGLSSGDVIQDYWNYDQDMVVDPGTYQWDGSGRTFDGIILYGKGNPGDVVLEVQPGSTVDGEWPNGGGIVNIRIRGVSDTSKAGWDIHDNTHVERYIYMDGGPKAPEDRHFYTPGGSQTATVTQSAWYGAVNNGAYTDSNPMDYSYCVAQDNNIANIRIGSGGDDYVSDTVIAIIDGVESDGSNSPNCRGLRVRQPTTAHVTRTLFDWRDATGAASPISCHESNTDLDLDHVVIYNETSNPAIRDKAGDLVVNINGPVIVGGPGNKTIEGSVNDPNGDLTINDGLGTPSWDWKAVTWGTQSPVAPFFGDVSGDPTTY